MKKELNYWYLLKKLKKKTSLDLLFIMDISGSMRPSINQERQNLINIINRITFENSWINVIIGFIGYIGVYEQNQDYKINIDLTQNHTWIVNKMQNINTSYGVDPPEDMPGVLKWL